VALQEQRADIDATIEELQSFCALVESMMTEHANRREQE
jgi:hypothetical protein